MPECRLSSTEVRVVFICNGQGKVGEAGNDGEEESGQEGDGADSEGKRSRVDEENGSGRTVGRPEPSIRTPRGV